MQVAVVDYGARDARSRFVRSLRETGFAILVDHPLADVVPVLGEEWLAFFATGAQHAYVHGEGEQDGYFPPPDPGERLPGGLVRDRKEFFHVRPDGRYPTEVSDTALRYFQSATALARELLGWLEADAPSLPLAGMIEGSRGTVLRVQHYLPLADGEPASPLRALAHEDINLLTLLPAPSEPGLQVCDRAGEWHDVPYDPRSLIVNGGEMLELATGGRYRATPHRVLNPTGAQSRGSRLSLPLFVHPAADVVLAPGRTASAFLQERVEALRQKGWAVAPGGKEVRA
jgi:isopenicillin N synthase-like dioxygenase